MHSAEPDVVKEYHCGLFAALDVVAGRWKVFIIWYLYPDCRRFGELRRMLSGVSEKVLTQQLRELEADGIISRKEFESVPPKVEYSLTSRGLELRDALEPLCRWGNGYMEEIGARVVEGGSQTKRFRKQR